MDKIYPNSETRQLEKRNRELSVLNGIAEALNGSVDLYQTLNTALAKVAELLELRTGWIWLLSEDNGESYLAAEQNLPPGLESNPQLMEGSCYCLDTFRSGDLEGAANINVITCSRLKKLVDGTGNLRYHASIPLYAHGKQLGVFNLASSDWRELTSDDLRLLYIVGDLLSIAVERARLFNQRAEFGAMAERLRLSRELHDTLAQDLTAISLQLETADAILEGNTGSTRARMAIEQALNLVREGLDNVRRSVYDLRAASLESRTLSDALRKLVEDISSAGRVHIEMQVNGLRFPLPSRVETGLYRIAQETLTNVARHSAASIARLELTIQPHKVTLLIEDNGIGFDLSRIKSGHFGLIGCQERANLLGGKFHIKSSPGEGTCVEVTIPLSADTTRNNGNSH